VTTDRDVATDLEAALRRAVAGEVAFDDYTRHLYARDASVYAIEPVGVLCPRDAADVAAAASVAAEHGVPVLARGAGTSLAGQAVGAALVLDFSRHMNAVESVDPAARTARVQPGVVQDQLNRAAAAHGLMFGPDTSTANRATIGGMIGNNSAGSGSVRYGMTIDHVRELDVVLSDASTARFRPVDAAGAVRLASAPTRAGSLYRDLPRLLDRHAEAIAMGYPAWWRQSGGYRLDRLARERQATGQLDLAKLVTGSEGTLAIVTGAVVALVPAPRHTAIAVGHFRSVQAAIEATPSALECGPDAVELIDRTILALAASKIEYRSLAAMLQDDPDALLYVTFSGDTEAEAVDGLDRLDAAWRVAGRPGSSGRHGYHTLRAVTPAEQTAVTRVRQAGLGLLMAASTGSRRPAAFIEDTAVDPARLPEYAARLKRILDDRGLRAGFYGHASVGCLHVRPFLDLARPAERKLMRAVAVQVSDLVAEFGGVNSSEHGDGLVRSEFNERVFGPALYRAFTEVKRLFDADGLLNPGKITGAPPITEHLRDAARAAVPVVPLRTRLAFAEGDMLSAADRCMNIGLCRKNAAGVMCPSYMATGQEEHSTRGRANALVKALSEADPKAALGSERLHGILDLCLGCKACKSECPLGVDLAALKAEALAAYYDVHGIPARARVLGSIRTVNRIGSALAPVSTVLAGSGLGRRAAQRLLGITAGRPVPRFERNNRATRHRGRRGAADVLYLADCFTSYTETAVALATVELLELAGLSVGFTGPRDCCGRAALSAGMVDRARRQAERLTGQLTGRLTERLTGPGAGATVPVTGAEPSCLLTLGDEYPALLPGDERAAALAGAIRPPEDLVLAAVAAGRLTFPADNPLAGQRILFHGHCHQKAITGTAATVALLRAIPGADVVELDAGCCGMAGSFGYEAEHYDLSLRIGQQQLFPAVQSEPEGTIIAATGFSCRQQIRHGTGRAARHPLELVLAAARPPT
jgi:FAD/FMN-containing dehydrogenase/Fe-S oxidoreductase